MTVLRTKGRSVIKTHTLVTLRPEHYDVIIPRQVIFFLLLTGIPYAFGQRLCQELFFCGLLFLSLFIPCKTTRNSAPEISVHMHSPPHQWIPRPYARRLHTLSPPSPKYFTQVSLELSASRMYDPLYLCIYIPRSLTLPSLTVPTLAPKSLLALI